MVSWGRCYTSLLEAAKDDVSQAFRQKQEIIAFSLGKHTGGKGMSLQQRQAKQHKAEMKRADAYARELETEMNLSQERAYIPDSGIHPTAG